MLSQNTCTQVISISCPLLNVQPPMPLPGDRQWLLVSGIRR
jgi:hypothetical protein